MEQHPIPQNVTSYQFRLVGDMTLKQFVELAAGILLGFLATRLPLIPVFIKWPAAGILAFGGVALAFLPVEERPLDVWLRNFVKSIYSPTQYLWKKKAQLPDFFRFTRSQAPPEPSRPKVKDQRQLQSYLQTLSQPTEPAIDKHETTALRRINQLLGTTPAPESCSTQPGMAVSPGIKSRRLRTPNELSHEVVVYEETIQEKPFQETPSKSAAPPKTPAQKPQSARSAQYRKQRPSPIPQTSPQTDQPGPVVEITPPPRPPLTVSSLFPQKSSDKKGVAPQFAQDLPLPSPPDIPNVIVGMVVDPENRLVPNAIVEIRNSQNQTARAAKTNKLGQFFISVPLLDDEYEIRIEHPELAFDIINLKAEGKVIPPIKIKAKQKRTPEIGNQEVS